jgi:hypothetical protein
MVWSLLHPEDGGKGFPPKLLNFNHTARHHIPEDSLLPTWHRSETLTKISIENLKEG